MQPILVQSPPQLFCPVCRDRGLVCRVFVNVEGMAICPQVFCDYKAEVPPDMLAQIEHRPRLPGME